MNRLELDRMAADIQAKRDREEKLERLDQMATWVTVALAGCIYSTLFWWVF